MVQEVRAHNRFQMDVSFSRFAIASMACALLFPLEFLAGIRGLTIRVGPSSVGVLMIATLLGAIVIGHAARREVRRSGFIYGGYGTASAGMVLGYLYVAFFSYLFVLLRLSR